MKACVVFLLVALCSCGTPGGRKTVVAVDRAHAPAMREAPASGSYALYSSDSRSPILTVTLKETQEVGFRKDPSGALVAVAGDVEIPLTAGRSYFWERL